MFQSIVRRVPQSGDRQKHMTRKRPYRDLVIVRPDCRSSARRPGTVKTSMVALLDSCVRSGDERP